MKAVFARSQRLPRVTLGVFLAQMAGSNPQGGVDKTMYDTQLSCLNEELRANGVEQREKFTDFCLTDLTSVSLDRWTQPQRDALENELALATHIQRAFLPDPRFSRTGWEAAYHYEPAGLLSGDYCDLLETKNGFFFFLGDVSGKGVPASMLMTHLHAIFRSLACDNPPVEAMVEEANHIFSKRTPAGQFATLVVGRADVDGNVEFASAGHLPFLHVGNGRTLIKRSTGIPLGVFAGARFGVRRFRLNVGDSLLLVTDGMTESVNPEGEEYGLERLKAAAGLRTMRDPSELVAECLTDHFHFTKGVKPADDLSLLAIRRTS
jgi:phosphoserine phosphatase RsbU/P